MKIRGILWALLGIVTLAPAMSLALGPVYWGTEFTFFNPNVPPGVKSGINRVVQRMRNHLVQNQPPGEQFTEELYIDEDVDYDAVPNGEYVGRDVSPNEATSLSIGKFSSPHGWSFEWGLDDGVIEIKMKNTLENYERFRTDMEDAIFSSARNEGLEPALYQGGGHINLGMQAFEGNDLLLRNFIVDLYNHNELFLGVLGYDTHNAASICIQAKSVQRRVASVINAFDRGRFAGRQADFLHAIQEALDSADDVCFRKWKTGGTRMTYFSMNYSHVQEGEPWSRIEIKCVRPQQSMDQWIRQIRLLQKRLLYLEAKTQPIPFGFVVPFEKIKAKKHLLNPPITAQAGLRAFYQYVTEVGERWEDHRDYVWPSWRFDGDLARFEDSQWFRVRQARLTNCEADLETNATFDPKAAK